MPHNRSHAYAHPGGHPQPRTAPPGQGSRLAGALQRGLLLGCLGLAGLGLVGCALPGGQHAPRIAHTAADSSTPPTAARGGGLFDREGQAPAAATPAPPRGSAAATRTRGARDGDDTAADTNPGRGRHRGDAPAAAEGDWWGTTQGRLARAAEGDWWGTTQGRLARAAGERCDAACKKRLDDLERTLPEEWIPPAAGGPTLPGATTGGDEALLPEGSVDWRERAKEQQRDWLDGPLYAALPAEKKKLLNPCSEELFDLYGSYDLVAGGFPEYSLPGLMHSCYLRPTFAPYEDVIIHLTSDWDTRQRAPHIATEELPAHSTTVQYYRLAATDDLDISCAIAHDSRTRGRFTLEVLSGGSFPSRADACTAAWMIAEEWDRNDAFTNAVK
ncbi:hypothetical protein C1Y63_05605 [Corynebacterium sp. 13CS0277]|uniref:hypothetical protein n=1 Tax=Corynebacterium sp. 13CS0277 TaxID=2071994 RepID=UPI000D022A75|nr:hypothetical protein [Corynebacterium sp. 13CS0277]PRQ11479.1 hypothetical protein C1Y63_05605 [Corynebacterium sp. 13CS0277]